MTPAEFQALAKIVTSCPCSIEVPRETMKGILLDLQTADQTLALANTKLWQCGHLVKLLRSYNPDHPMGAGMAAQFKQIMEVIENG